MATHRVFGLLPLVVGVCATTVLSACALPSFVPGVGGSGSFDAALEDAWSEPGEAITFTFNDTRALRGHIGADYADDIADTSSLSRSDAGLATIGTPTIVLDGMTDVDGLDSARRDIGEHSDWSQTSAQGQVTTSTTTLGALPSGMADALVPEGWTRPDDTTLWAGDAVRTPVPTTLLSVEDGRFTTANPKTSGAGLAATRDFVATRGERPLVDDERFSALRDCIGDSPLAVSFRGLSAETAGVRAYALITEVDGDDLAHRSCLLAGSDSAAASDLLESAPQVGRRRVRATEVAEDGDVISADLVSNGGQTPMTLAVWMHSAFPELAVPGF